MNIKVFLFSFVLFGLLSLQTHAQDTLYVDAGGFELRMVKKGSGAGPTVIMDNGGDMSLEWWFGLDDSLANYATVVTYDRAYLGKSGKGNPDRSGEVVAAELKRALENAGIKPPYVLVGFSMGCYYAKAFARTNPDDTKGLLLIDPLNTEAFYKELEKDFPESFQWGLPKKDDPITYELQFAIRSEYGDDGVPPNIPVQLLIAEIGIILPENVEPPYENFEEDNTAIQKIWIKHHLIWASRYPHVKSRLVEDASHAIHRSRMDAVLESFHELIKNSNY
jgi:dienelactone hydrolase